MLLAENLYYDLNLKLSLGVYVVTYMLINTFKRLPLMIPRRRLLVKSKLRIDLWHTLQLGISKTGYSSCVNKWTIEAGHVG